MIKKQQAKAILRRQIRADQDRLTPTWIANASQLIQERCLALAEWSAAQYIACYLAQRREVQTARLIAAAHQAGKEIWVPAWHPSRQRYQFVRLLPAARLIPGHYGIEEPEQPSWQSPAQLDLVLVPGLAFDRRGGRLGQGRGHYDQLLAQPAWQAAWKIGLAFAFQVRRAVPTLAHDITMNLILTERARIPCRPRRPRRAVAETMISDQKQAD